jgi:amidase
MQTRRRSRATGTLDATGAAQLVAEGEASALDLVDAAIKRIEALNPKLNFIAAEAFEQARARAKARNLEGPFAGVPYLLKDLVEYPGLPFRHGSRMFANAIGMARPPLVERHEGAGLILAGKSTTPEFGLTGSTEPILTGATRNPWNLTHTPGGSSGGAAAAVASGAVAIAHASDGGGSIRIPASCCGVFGLKPSRGRQVSAKDEDPGPIQLSVNHCLSRSVRDSARLLAITQRSEEGAPYKPVRFVSGPAKERLKIGVSTRRLDNAEGAPDARAATQATADLCRSLGHTIMERDLPIDGPRFIEAFVLLWAAGAFTVAQGFHQASGAWPDDKLLEPWTLALVEHFRAQPQDALGKAYEFLTATSAQIDRLFNEVDVMLTPVVDGAAPKIGYLDPRLPFETHFARAKAFVGYTPIHNVAGTPAMSVPLFWTAGGLPVGSQFAAGRGREATLLALAYELEAARPWADKHPDVFAA